MLGFLDIVAQFDCVSKDKALINALFVAIVVSPPFKTQYRNLSLKAFTNNFLKTLLGHDLL